MSLGGLLELARVEAACRPHERWTPGGRRIARDVGLGKAPLIEAFRER